MLVHKLGHYPTRFHLDGEIPSSYGSGTFASRLERMHVRGDTCKHLYQPLTTPTHMLGACVIPQKPLLENRVVFVHCIVMTACSCHHATLHLSIVIIMHINLPKNYLRKTIIF